MAEYVDLKKAPTHHLVSNVPNGDLIYYSVLTTKMVVMVSTTVD